MVRVLLHLSFSATVFSRATPEKDALLNPAKSKNERALEEDLARRDAEMNRVAALPTTSDWDRANLAERLHRLKKNARMR
jgi:hypothetical protein